MKVYLDTTILSRVTDLKLSEEDARAYRLLAENQEVSLVTSLETKRELERTPNAVRNEILRFLCVLFRKIPHCIGEVSARFGSVPFGRTSFGGKRVDPTLQALRGIFEPDDAQHIFLAARDRCDYFLTFDEKTILSRVRANPHEIASLCGGMRFASPKGMLKLLEN